MAITSGFDPTRDGWFFHNWGEKSDFSWDLYRETYLGIYPTQDYGAAPLQCAFYDKAFKICAQGGNCGGMSLLALAIFTYGGYMGFCAPASFYGGDFVGDLPELYRGPDRADLHRAINVLQARQFSSPGIENFVQLFRAGDINNAHLAFQCVEELIAQRDYPVISLNDDTFGPKGHTLIPYRTEEQGGEQFIYLWDPNYPHNANTCHYAGETCRLVIRGPTDWFYDPAPGQGHRFSGAGGGWCFAIPMSLVLRKSRAPSLDNIPKEVIQLLFTGAQAASEPWVS